MGNTKTLLTSAILSLSAIAVPAAHCAAQGWEKEREYSDQHLRESLEAADRARVRNSGGTPNTPSSSSHGAFSTVSERYDKRMADRAKMAEEVAETQRRLKIATEDYKRRQAESAAAAKASDARRMAEESAANARWEPIRQVYLSYPFFTANDADVLARRSLTPNGTRTGYADEIMGYPAAYKHYLAISGTGDYEEVLSAIYDFKCLTSKTEEALEALATRFPERQQQIDSIMVKAWYYYMPDTKLNDPGSMLRLAKRLPPRLLADLSNWHRPTQSLHNSIYDAKLQKKDPAAIIALEKEYFEVSNQTLIKEDAFEYMREYLAPFSPQELMLLGKKKGVSPAFLFWNYKYDSYKGLVNDYGYTFSQFYHKKKQNGFPKTLPPIEVWKKFADAGDADATELYAKAVEFGFTDEKKESAAEWHRRAKEAKAANGY